MSVTVEALRKVPLLSELKEKELRNLASRMRETTHEAGDVVIQEGAGGIGFFMILEGSADVLVGGEKRATLHAGDFFGELSLFNDGAVRSATVRARETLRSAGMPSWDFRAFVQEHADVAWTLLCTMAARVAETRRQQAPAGVSP